MKAATRLCENCTDGIYDDAPKGLCPAWVNQYSGSDVQFSAVSFTDANTGTAVGSLGAIVRTTDAGSTWIEQTSGTSNLLQGVSFTDANNGMAVSLTAEIIRTTDGGTTWGFQSTPGPNTDDFRAVSFTDSLAGTVVGLGGAILRTTDAGQTWLDQVSGITSDLWAVSFIDANDGHETLSGNCQTGF